MHALYLYYYENYVGAAMLYTLIIYMKYQTLRQVDISLLSQKNY